MKNRKKHISAVSADNLPSEPCTNTANSAEFVPTTIDGPVKFTDPMHEVFDFVPTPENRYKIEKLNEND